MRRVLILLILTSLSVLVFAQQEPVKKAEALDWSVVKTGNVGLTFFIKGREVDRSFTYQDVRTDRPGILWGHSKVQVEGYPSPVLIGIFGHGAKAYSLKIIDPLKPEKERVLFEQESISDLPTYELIGSRPVFKAIKISYLQDAPLEDPKMEELYGNMQNSQLHEVVWPKDARVPQSKQSKKQ